MLYKDRKKKATNVDSSDLYYTWLTEAGCYYWRQNNWARLGFHADRFT